MPLAVLSVMLTWAYIEGKIPARRLAISVQPKGFVVIHSIRAPHVALAAPPLYSAACQQSEVGGLIFTSAIARKQATGDRRGT